MATQTDVLKAICKKEEPVAPGTLASEFSPRASDATVTTLLHKLKKKGLVEGEGKEWMITDTGRAAVAKEEAVPTTRPDVGVDEISKFQSHGLLAGCDPDKIAASLELFQNLDMRSMEAFDKVMADIDIPQVIRHPWRSLYLGYLRNTTPPEDRDDLYPIPKVAVAEVVEAAAGERVKKEGESPLDYLVEDGNRIVRVGEDLGMFTFRQALQVVAATRGTSPPSPSDGGSALKDVVDAFKTLNPNQPMTAKEILDLVKEIVEKKPDDKDPPVQSPGFFVNESGQVTELKPGQPIVVTKVEHQAGKTFVLAPDGELVEQEAGKPLVIKVQGDGGGGGGMPQMLPFPVMGEDGQMVHDKDGNPVYANLEPMMKYMGFANEQRRAEGRHNALMGLAQTVKENLGDGIAALKAAAGEAKGATGSKESSTTDQPQVFSCGECNNQFSAPSGWAGQSLKCPTCGHEYTKEELLA